MVFVYGQTLYNKHTGERHDIEIVFGAVEKYHVRVDNEFYSTAEHRAQAFDEVLDIIKTNNWTPICPI